MGDPTLVPTWSSLVTEVIGRPLVREEDHHPSWGRKRPTNDSQTLISDIVCSLSEAR
jgi:hypothetical protein